MNLLYPVKRKENIAVENEINRFDNGPLIAEKVLSTR